MENPCIPRRAINRWRKRMIFLTGDADQHVSNGFGGGMATGPHNIVSKGPRTRLCYMPVGDDHGNNSPMDTRRVETSKLNCIVIDLPLSRGSRKPCLGLY